ncbi:MAG TPA: aldehyde dehydrogenase family protein [bacterium]|nr:aldehyde dehydrogenase family protein [bacterium]
MSTSSAHREAKTRVVVDVNPADTTDVLAEVRQATAADVEPAVARAKAAFEKWRDVPAPERGRVLARAASITRARADELARLLTREEGKIVSEARGEIIRGAVLLEWFAGEGFRMGGRTRPSEMPSTVLFTLRQPLGVVAVITPWNFPWAEPVWKAGPALVAGNAVILKPATLTPLLADEYAKILLEAGLPEHVLQVLPGSGGEVGDALVDHPDIKAVSFTGSTAIGSDVYARAARRLAKVTCEMGGKNAVVVMPDADLDVATNGVASGAFGSTGQRCTATSLCVVHRDIVQDLTERIVAYAKKMRLGNGLEKDVDMGPLVDAHQLDSVLGYIDGARREGLRLATGGRRATEGACERGYFVEPTVFVDVPAGARIAQEEVFGPVLSVVTVGSLDEALAVTNGVKYGLSSSIYARDSSAIMRFLDRVEVGMVHVNSPTVGGEAQVPFGGIKWSGVGGREMAEEGLEFYTELKTVFFDYTGKPRESKIY